MAIWTWFVGTRIGRWIVGLALVIGALAVGALTMFEEGRHAQAKTDTAKDAQSLAEAAQASVDAANRSAEVVKVTHEEVSKMPDAGTQRVGDAAAGTAAGWLREHASRDQSPHA